MQSTTSRLGHDRGLQTRMLLTLFLLGLLYAAFMAVLFAAGTGAVTMALIAAAFLALQYFTSDKIALAASGARVVEPADQPELHGMIDRLCVQADLPKPRVAIIDSSVPNAFAMGRSPKHATVAASTAIIDLLSPAELEGVIAHELSHVANRDVALMTLASFFASIASMIVQFGFYFGGGQDDDDDGPGIFAVIAAAALVYAISFVLMRTLSRYREYAADRGAAELTGRPSALASALLRISGQIDGTPQVDLRQAHAELNAFYIVPVGLKRGVATLFSTHPPMADRVARLQAMESSLQRGPLAGGIPAGV